MQQYEPIEIPGWSKQMIIVRCERTDLDAQHVYIAANDEGLRLIWLRVTSNILLTVHSEYMPYEEYPEARAIFDGVGWDLSEIANWIDGVDIAGPDSPTLAEMDKRAREQIHESTRLHTTWSTGT